MTDDMNLTDAQRVALGIASSNPMRQMSTRCAIVWRRVLIEASSSSS
jgi:hypothetical protein